ncbi:hypothetical protein [Micromonospora avicenniae]|uniref:hypothetical protein n=1 Tax=Micromonospora avicenniae TaxID=1198245 RepID=UPI003426F139
MTEWRDATAFFLTSGEGDDERWLRSLSERIDLRSEGLAFDEYSRTLNCEWAGLECRAEVISGPTGGTLVISYFARDFRDDVAAQPDRWREFCHLFARACLDLAPTAAVALGTISDDVRSDIHEFDRLIAERNAVGLRDSWYALLYLAPGLEPAAVPDAAPPSHQLPNGGLVSWDWRYDDFPE